MVTKTRAIKSSVFLLALASCTLPPLFAAASKTSGVAAPSSPNNAKKSASQKAAGKKTSTQKAPLKAGVLKNSAATLRAMEKGLDYLPSEKEAQEKLFAHLQEKLGAGETVALPTYPANELLPWFFNRYNPKPADTKAAYRLLYEDALIMQDLMSHSGTDAGDLQQRRRGLKLAIYSASHAVTDAKDAPLRVLITEAFLLTHLQDAYAESWIDTGRQFILDRAYSAYADAGDAAKQLLVLRLTAQTADTANTRDRARIQMTQLYEKQKRYKEAIRALATLELPNWQDRDAWNDRLLRQRDQQDIAEANKQIQKETEEANKRLQNKQTQ